MIFIGAVPETNKVLLSSATFVELNSFGKTFLGSGDALGRPGGTQDFNRPLILSDN